MGLPPDNSTSAPRRVLTDSPWYWLMWFSLIALVGLQAVGYKYGQRQAQIERQHQALQWAQLDRQAAETAAIEYSTPERTIITLWPLRVLLLALLVVSTVGLVVRRPPQEDSM